MIAVVLSLLAAGQPLTLAEARARAVDANPELAAERKKLDVARAGVDAAGQLPNPTVGVSVGPDEPVVFGTVDVKLPIFGQRGTAIEAARREQLTQQAQIEVAQRKLLAQVRRAYFGLAAAQQGTQAAAEAQKLAVELAGLAQRKLDAGQAARIDVEQAEVGAARAEQDLIDRQAAEADARQSLLVVLGAPPDAELTAADALAPAPRPPPLEELLAKLTGHAEVVELQREREAAQARADAERAAVRPVPDVSLEVEKLSGSPAIGLRAGLAFELPILSQNGGRIRREEASAAVSAAQIEAAQKRLASALRAAFARFEAANKREQLSRLKLVPAAERLLATARAGFEIGRTPFLAVVQAQAEVAAARGRALDAAAEAQRAFADVEEAAGGL